jgi:signal transduction histidine kinase
MVSSVYVAADLIVGSAFIFSALFVWRHGRARLPAALLMLAGTSWFVGNLGGLPGVAGVVATTATYAHRGPLTQLVLTLPNGRPRSRVVLGAVLVGYVVAAVAVLGRSEVVALGVSVGLIGVTLVERRMSVDALPVTAMAAALAGPALARLLLPVSASGGALLWYDGCLLVLAAALTARLVRARRVVMADLVVGLSVAPSQGLRDALARAVGDPTLQVAYVEGDGFVNARGEPLRSDPDDLRTVTPLSRDGQAFGFISHDPAVLADPLLVEAVATAAALTSANARLQADVERQAAQVRASRRRIVSAGFGERRRLEAELSLGPGARLERVEALLDAVPASGTQEGLVDVARNQARRVTSDLRDLARGLHPVALRTSGLAGALADLAASAPLPVSVEVDVQEVPDGVAETLYYVCAEGLTNVARHAEARSASIRLIREGNRVHVTVADDGAGGADPSGSGLRGLADRVQALGGELSVTSDPVGTRLTARMPTDS